jgi:hypothetical protein
MANRIVNFQMQQPGEMANPQVVGVGQQNRMKLAERLRQYGLGGDETGSQQLSDSFNQQMQYGDMDRFNRPTEALSPQQQRAGQIMKGYNAPGGGSEMGWRPSAPMSAQRGMMGDITRAGIGIGDAMSGIGKGLGKGLGSLGKGLGGAVKGAGGILKVF